MKKEVFSSTLNKNIPVKTNGKINIIKHATLDAIANELQINTKFDIISSDINHAVVLCVAEYNKMKVTTIGESVKETLFSDEEKRYPVTIAWNRAYDRCVIKLLKLTENAFSNSEINEKAITSALKTIDTPMPKVELIKAEVETKKEASKEKISDTIQGQTIKNERLLFGKKTGTKICDLTKEEIDQIKSAHEKNPFQFKDERKEKQLRYILSC